MIFLLQLKLKVVCLFATQLVIKSIVTFRPKETLECSAT